MARRTTRRGGIGGYIKGFLAGVLLVVLVLVGLAVLAPVEGELAEVDGGEPDPAEVASGLGDEPGGEAVVDIQGVEEEETIEEAAEAEPLEEVEPAPGDEEEAIQPVELAELPADLPEIAGGAVEPGGADAMPEELEEILEGVDELAEAPEETVDIGGAAEAEEEAADEETGAADMPPPLPGARPVALDGPALEVNAASYAVAEEAPLVGVILDGVADSELSPDVLFALPVPVTLGIVPGREGDEALAEAARGRNWEVLAQLPIADGEGEPEPGALSEAMPPEEIAERTEALLGRLSQAVAAASEGALDDPAAVEALLGTLEEHGFGYVGAGVAAGEGPPNAQPTRTVPPDASAEEVLSALEEAAGEAGPSGAALVVLPPTRAAAEALARWNAEAGAGRIAPLSAVIRRQAGG